MINVNDLIGLRYGWNKRPGDGSNQTDCFQLACEIHRRLGFGDYSDKYEWVYRQYSESQFPRRLIARWLLKNATRVSEPETGLVVLLPAEIGCALGTYVDLSSVVFIGPGHTVIRASMDGVGQLFRMNQ